MLLDFFFLEKNLSCKAAQAVPIKTGNNIKTHYQQSKAQLLPLLKQHNRQEMPVNTFIIPKRHLAHVLENTFFHAFLFIYPL